MRVAFPTAISGVKPCLVLGLTRFAEQAFTGGNASNAAELMAAMGQASQLLDPDAVWIDLLHLTQLASDKANGGLAGLRAVLGKDVTVASVSRNLISVRSAVPSGKPLLLHLGSPADWIAYSGETPSPELDDLDAEDVLVYLVNFLQRLDLEEINALSIDASHPVLGEVRDYAAVVDNYCEHQGLDIFISKATAGDEDPSGMTSYELRPLAEAKRSDFNAWILDPAIPPDDALKQINHIRNAGETPR